MATTKQKAQLSQRYELAGGRHTYIYRLCFGRKMEADNSVFGNLTSILTMIVPHLRIKFGHGVGHGVDLSSGITHFQVDAAV